MTIHTSAIEYLTGTTIPDIKHPGRELQLLIQTADGQTQGSLRVARVESDDLTNIEFAAERRAKTLHSLLAIEGLTDPINLRRKHASRSFRHATEHIQIRPVGKATLLLDQDTHRSYQSLEITLQPAA